ncbi:MAG: hypothetical protein U5K71_08340 [Gracilimonas sp.]|nr:hypothetical protein [Gracilimonas sp.]
MEIQGLEIVPPKNGIFDRMLKPILVNDGVLLVQVDRREIVNKESLESNNSVLSYLIDTRTGAGQFYSNELGRIQHLSEHRLIEVNESFTEFEIYEKE